jgi:hypothetical protein
MTLIKNLLKKAGVAATTVALTAPVAFAQTAPAAPDTSEAEAYIKIGLVAFAAVGAAKMLIAAAPAAYNALIGFIRR